ncbi:MAG: hypothetical protein IPF53_08055 [Blastocatellia bacterium]|nr:hypothetical protein [Blastocatellia bacterium]
MIGEMNRHLRGWANYFGFGYPRGAPIRVDPIHPCSSPALLQREREAERGSGTGIVRRPESSPVRFDDRPGDGEPHPQPVALGSEVGLENLVEPRDVDSGMPLSQTSRLAVCRSVVRSESSAAACGVRRSSLRPCH